MTNSIFFKRKTNDGFFLTTLLGIPLGIILMLISWKFIFLTLASIILLIWQEDNIWNSLKKK